MFRIGLTLMLVCSASTALAQTIPIERVRSEFLQALEGRDAYKQMRFTPAAGSLLDRFYQDDQRFVDYIVSNRYALPDEFRYWHAKEPDRFGAKIQDSQYTNLVFERLLPTFARYVSAKHLGTVEGVVLRERAKLTLDHLATYAAKFFYPDSVTPAGGIASHICIGFNGFQDQSSPRNLILEAFCYDVVNSDLLGEHRLLPEYEKALELVGSLRLSDEPRTKLLRAQGVAWAVMSRSSVLQAALSSEYAKRKDWLTFDLEQ